MKKRRLLGTLGCVVGTVLLATSVVQAQDPFIFDTLGGVNVWSFPQPSPGEGYEATIIKLQGVDESAKLVTFENLRFDGEIVQTWLSGPFAAPTAKGAPTAGATYDASWIPYDSHVLIRDNDPNMVGGGAGGSYGGITEDNDGSIGAIPGLPQASGFDPNSGLGSIYMGAATDAFFLDTAFQANLVDLAYLVSPTGAGAADGHVSMTLGVLGEGITNSGEAGGAQWGFGENPDPLGIMFSQGEVGPRFCDTSTADICFDFDADDEGAQLITPGDLGSAIVLDGTGSGPSEGYLRVTDAVNGARGGVIAGRIVLGGRTGGANGNHHADNFEVTTSEGSLSIRADLRVGGGTDQPADGFSFNYVDEGDPVLAGDGNGWAGLPSGAGTETNLPEEGTTTGISIGFDEWQSGPAGDPADLSLDVIGLTLRIDGEIVGNASLPTLNGALDDVTSLQTGPNTGGKEALGWATLTINAPLEGANLSNTVVTWKGQVVPFVPEPASGLMALMSLVGFGMLRRRIG